MVQVSYIWGYINRQSFLSTIPGAFVDLYYEKITTDNILSNPGDINVYKFMLVNIIDNVLSEKIGNPTRTESTLRGGYIGQTFTTTGSNIIDKITE